VEAVMAQPDLPLSALFSLAWTAFTIEVDNAFEARMPHRTTRWGHPRGVWLVPHAMGWTCMRFVGATGVSLRELEGLARTRTNINPMLRWSMSPSTLRRRAGPTR
jgi:hypothetical protein